MIIIDFLFSLPLWLLLVVLAVSLMGFSLVGLWVTRRWLIPWLRLDYEDAYYAAPLVQSASSAVTRGRSSTTRGPSSATDRFRAKASSG